MMVVEGSAPDERIAVRIGLYFCTIDIKLPERNEPLFLQPVQELIVQLVQHLAFQFFSFEVIEGIPLWLLSFGQQDKSKVSLTEIYNTVNRTPRIFA